MRTKILILFFALAASVGTIFAWDYERVQIDDLYYNLDASNQTAEVTSQNSSSPYWSTAITTADIPASVTYNAVIYSVTRVGSYAFSGCTGLTSVTIPNSVTNFGYEPFGYCIGLTSIEIPNSVTNLGWYAFRGCTGLTSIEIPNSVTNLGNCTFFDCTNLTSVEIPNSVTDIGANAFYNCSSLTSVEIPNSISRISSGAFSNCSGLTSVVIPNSVISIDLGAFDGCTGLTSVMIPNSVTYIDIAAFYNCSSLTSLTIPASVHSIEYQAFAECSGLTSITVGAGNPIYDSRNGCNAIIETASNTLVVGCQNTIIPNSVTSIRENAFEGCSSLNSMTIPSSVTSIGSWAFYGCTSLISIEIPNGVTAIEDNTFEVCTSLTSVTIPNSVTSIGSWAFSSSGLTSITIPNSVTSIGEFAFEWCEELTSITCEAVTPPTLDNDVFDGVDKSIPLYVPAGSITAYQAADQWRDFTNIQAIPTMAITANEDPLNAGDFYTTFYHGTKRYRLPGDGTEAYMADLSGGELLLTRIAQGNQVLPNNVAVIFRAPTSTITLSETSTTGVSFSAENDLRGVDVVTPLDDLGLTRSTCYVLSGNSTDGVGFFQCNSDNLKAHKAYLPYAGGPAGAPRHIRFVFDETEDLNNVQRNNVPSSKILRNGQLIIIRNGVEYNVAGQIVK